MSNEISISISLLCTVLGAVLGVLGTIMNYRSNIKKETSREADILTTLKADSRHIRESVGEIKSDLEQSLEERRRLFEYKEKQEEINESLWKRFKELKDTQDKLEEALQGVREELIDIKVVLQVIDIEQGGKINNVQRTNNKKYKKAKPKILDRSIIRGRSDT